MATQLWKGKGKKLEDPLAKLNLKEKPFEFWDSQPVPKLTEEIPDGVSCPIDAPKTVADVRPEPYALHPDFVWSDTDVNDPKTLQEIYTLLYENYVEDDDNMFRFDYSKDFLKWALTPPGFRLDWHVGVRVKSNQKLVGFITAIPAKIAVYGKEIDMVEINFLCVHKKLRAKRLAPLLIREITRRVNLTDVWQAVYTGGIVIPKPVASCRYWHRSLNPQKLIDVKFSHLGPRMTLSRTIKLYRLPEKAQIPGLRPLQEKDVVEVQKMVAEYLKQFPLHPILSVEEFKHWLLPRDGVINSYVVEDPTTHKITDFTSFYTLPSTIIGNTKYKTLKAAYSYYNVATKHDLKVLINDALTMAKLNDFDVYNCLDIQENEVFLKELKFCIGDGNLQYYLYNWRCPAMPSKGVGLVLL
eukprot:TRINITY_DN1959_c0_g1_i1.p1 TRINITY_DN1959_c0_g1~~TRINITY_DN1959_c0_g1_i1.p1  ORF type:complete len:412 (-),score=110.65 TRINITY_DN1959_c0_g1_i1:26-1261(-)